MPKPHNNQELFSNYYLEERLPERDTWQEPEGLTVSYRKISDLYEERKDILESTKEAQTEEEWIKPILKVLGFKYITQPSESIFDTTKVPDYAFFLNDENKKKAYKAAEDNKEDLFNFALAVGDAKRWGRNLNELSPNKQIDEYLRITDSKWGILTNGRLWRIYHLDSSYRLDIYYEVDLVSLIESENQEKFKYFYLFFRPHSFVEDGFLSEVYDRSEDFTASVSEDLKENAFDALRELCQGFLSGNPELGEEDLDDIYENSLVLLYRLIFLLYAESEDEENLLPMDNETYRESHSLEALKKKVIKKKKNDKSFLSSSHRYWGWLRELFSFIDKGEETLGVYEYNGGLFDSKKQQFLDEKYKIGNKYIAEAIRKVSYSETEGGFIDYQDLDVRELGAIYEGLLEHKPVVEEEKVKWEEDLSERKKTGSYYTPEYIVKYIVENTIGPLVEEKKEEIEEEINELKEKLKGSRGYDRETYQRKLEEKRKEVREEIFDLKVLDPAMGSGHFLVEATEKLANSIASLEEEFSPEEEEEPDTKTQDPGRKNTVKALKREIVERSIYGVDKNPLATELAKLSLWLHTVAKGEPLSFLDHHLRTGDSLIGINIEEMKTMPSEREQMAGLFTSNLVQDLGKAIGHLNLIEEITSGSRDDVQEKKGEWRDVRSWVDKYKKAANVRLSTSFENEVSDDEYRKILQAAANNNLEQVEGEDYFDEAQKLADEKSFFHWELEFPDVFRNKQGKKKSISGFDAVVGNPPYFSCLNLTEYEENLLRSKYEKLWASRNDISYYFYLEFFKKLKKRGKIAFIFPRYYLKSHYAQPIRGYLAQNSTLHRLVDTGNDQVFPDADILTTVLVAENSTPQGVFLYITASTEDEKLIFDDIAKVDQETITEDKWIKEKILSKELYEKIENSATLLGELVKVGKGMSTGKNKVFEISLDKHPEFKGKEYIKPLVKNGDIRKFKIKKKDKYVIYPEGLEDLDPYPKLKQYLLNHESSLRGRSSHSAEWYKYSTPRNKAIWEYNGDKILVPFMATENRFAIDSRPAISTSGDVNALIPNESVNIDLNYLIAILNSKLMEFYHFATTKLKRDHYKEYVTKQLRKLPIKILEQEDQLAKRSIKISQIKNQLDLLNLNIMDYLGQYSEGVTLAELSIPAKGVSDTILNETTATADSLRLGTTTIENEKNELLLKASVRYKPEDNKNSQDLDKWGYKETDPIPTMRFSLDDKMKILVEEFIPFAVEKGGGFADFRKNATKTISPLERLEKLTLPRLDDVESSLEKFREQKEKATKLEKEVQNTIHQTDAIVFDLYNLSEEEVRKVLDSLETPEDEKSDILQKFRQVG